MYVYTYVCVYIYVHTYLGERRLGVRRQAQQMSAQHACFTGIYIYVYMAAALGVRRSIRRKAQKMSSQHACFTVQKYMVLEKSTNTLSMLALQVQKYKYLAPENQVEHVNICVSRSETPALGPAKERGRH